MCPTQATFFSYVFLSNWVFYILSEVIFSKVDVFLFTLGWHVFKELLARRSTAIASPKLTRAYCIVSLDNANTVKPR